MSTEPLSEGYVREVGAHRLIFEVPDTLLLQLNGTVDVDCIRAGIQAVKEARSRLYIIRDARNSGPTTQGARELLLKEMPVEKLIAVLTFGAPFHVRTVVTMLGRALRLLRPNAPPFLIFGPESEARLWIQMHRTKTGIAVEQQATP